MQPDEYFMLVCLVSVSLIWFIMSIPVVRLQVPKIYFTVRSWWWMLLLLFAAYISGALMLALFFAMVGIRAMYEVGRILHPIGKQQLIKKLVQIHGNPQPLLVAPELIKNKSGKLSVIDWLVIICVGLFTVCAILLSFHLINHHQGVMLFFVLFSSQFSDVAQYLCGKLFGRKWLPQPLFIKKISPNKTLEGAIVGPIFSSLIGGILGYWLINFPFWQCVTLAFSIAWLGIFGDLLESAFKRQHGIKDTCTILAGHGGILDRIDSLLLSVPAFSLIYWLVL